MWKPKLKVKDGTWACFGGGLASFGDHPYYAYMHWVHAGGLLLQSGVDLSGRPIR